MVIVICSLIFITFYTLIITYIERKFAAKIQNRIGPNVVGIKGLLQPLADILKLIQKTNITPKHANKILFIFAPILIFVSVFASLAPLNPALPIINLNVGIYYTLAFLSIKIVGVIIAGFSSYNKFSFLAAIRSCVQLISYEIPLMLAIISVLVVIGSLQANIITLNQSIDSPREIYLFAMINITKIGGFFAWNIFRAPTIAVAFIIYFITSMMASNRGPFDTLEAESEIVAGYHTEYSSVGFALFMLSEYLSMFVLCILASIIFFGGGNSILPNLGVANLSTLTTGYYWNIFWILLKTFTLILLQIWFKWFLPRLRPDQVIILCWKYLIPISLCNLISSMLWVILTR